MLLNETAEDISRTDKIENQSIIYDELRNYIKENDVKKAVLIQYSGNEVQHIIKLLLSKKADVTLYIQNEKTAEMLGIKYQVDRILKFKNGIEAELYSTIGNRPHGGLIVYQFDPPVSLRRIKIDDNILAVGPYIYRYPEPYDLDERNSKDTIVLKGHDQPGQCFYKTTSYSSYRSMVERFDKLANNFKNGKQCISWGYPKQPNPQSAKKANKMRLVNAASRARKRPNSKFV